MDAIKDLFSLLIWIVIILVGIALFSYNKLQRLSQDIQEKSSNVQVAISRKLSLINQLIDVVKNFQEGEQFTHLKISADSTASGLMSAYQQSGAVLASLQGMAQRFPNLKANEQYHRLIDSIQACETDIQRWRQAYNATVKNYNTVCLSIPTVFVARAMGFGKAPYLEFDISGVNDVTTLKDFKTDDGERLQQMLTSAGGNIAGMTKAVAIQATQKGKMLVDRAKEKATPHYFYMVPGGVPQGPLSLQDIKTRIAAGALDETVRVAEVGSSDWRSVADVSTASAEAPA